MAELKIFTGNAHPVLASRVSDRLRIDLGDAQVGRFSDGEVSVEIIENVRGKDVFIIQPTCTPCNDNLMELIVMVDCLHRASAGRITAVIPISAMPVKIAGSGRQECQLPPRSLQIC